jgi:S-(hydroxymethyl)glutathione dehydrogenase / alcohol dehydrogenase
MKTKAAILYELNKPVRIEELIVPSLKAGQVLVKIAFSGVCHSQLNEVRGLKGEDRFLPHTLGHEGTGVVIDIGPEVKKVKLDDRVILTWIKGLGIDVPSVVYQKVDGSRVNSGAISTFMEYAVVSENRVVPFPGGLPMDELSLLGCAIPTGAGMALNSAKVKQGSAVAVFGLGGIGLSALIGSRLMGATTIIAVDKFPHKLEAACSLGATHAIEVGKSDILEEIKRITEGHGVDYAFEAAGVSIAMEEAFRSVRDGGGLCVLAGNLPQGEEISINPLDLIKGKRIVGTWGGETNPDNDIPVYLNWYREQKLKLSGLVAKKYALSEINQALEDLEAGELKRGLINMDSEG